MDNNQTSKTNADRRRELQSILEDIMEGNKVYFQPPSNVKMSYPCIRYKLADIETRNAGNKKYKTMNRYEVILIDSSPVSKYLDPIMDLEYCSFERAYSADNLNHYVFTIFK